MLQYITLKHYHNIQAAEVLYDVGFPIIGQIHAGNVFLIKNDSYALGGYENTLLGYRTSCFQALKEENYLDQMDAIMFGEIHIAIFSFKLQCS